MTIEQQVFDRRRIEREKLIAYGFQPEGNRLVFYKTFFQDGFEAQITYEEHEGITGRVIDLDFGGEYLGLRITGTAGAYRSGIREEYAAILEDIAAHCSHKLYFYTPQANRIGAWLMDACGCSLRFPWPRLPGHGLFEAEGETFASIINVDRFTGDRQSRTAEELNIRAEGEQREVFLRKEGILPPYYKTAKHWVAIPLDGRFSDGQIKALVAESGQMACTQNAWIIPANNSRYDLIGHFAARDTIVWKQMAGAHAGDAVYLYMAKPYSSVLYRCRVTQTNLPGPGSAKAPKGMELKLEETYESGRYPFSLLKEYGINFYRGSRKAPPALKEVLENPSK